MSTADSQLLVCSSALAEDLLHKLKINQRVSPLLLGRVGVFAIGLLAAIVAMKPDSQVLDIVSYAWAGLGASFGPIILISLYWEKTSHTAAVAGIVVGGVTVVIWKQLSGGLFDLYELVPGFLFSSFFIVVTSYLFPNTDTPINDKYQDFLKRVSAN